MSLYGLLRPVDVSPSIEQVPPWTPAEALEQTNTADATFNASFEVPDGEIWDLLACNAVNSTTALALQRISLIVAGSGLTVVIAETLSAATAGTTTPFIASQPILLYPGDVVRINITDPGVGDSKVARVLFRRYYQRAPPAI